MYGRNLTQVLYIDNNYCGHVGVIVIYGSVHIHSWKSETKNEKGARPVNIRYVYIHTFIHTCINIFSFVLFESAKTSLQSTESLCFMNCSQLKINKT